jgi:hypothetical protein
MPEVVSARRVPKTEASGLRLLTLLLRRGGAGDTRVRTDRMSSCDHSVAYQQTNVTGLCRVGCRSRYRLIVKLGIAS